MPSHIADRWSFAISFLEMRYGDRLLASGSGFFWMEKDRTFLVSNWHNFSGRDPGTGQAISKSAGVPDRIVFTAFRQVSVPDSEGFFELKWEKVSVQLYQTDTAAPLWIEHPQWHQQVDIAAIDVSSYVEGLQIERVNLLEDDALLEPFVSQDVFIVGFPLGLVTGTPVPVWKRGTIATDPKYDPDGLPKIFVDAATRSGMSGSVAIARHIVLGSYRKIDGSTVNTLYARRDRILGVYSGRLHPDNVQAQLGLVWKRTLIENITTNGVAPVL